MIPIIVHPKSPILIPDDRAEYVIAGLAAYRTQALGLRFLGLGFRV